MNVLVVGGAGYVGSVVVERLLSSGHRPIVLDSLISGHAEAVHPEAELLVADCRDEEALERLFIARQPEAVLYMGGYIQAGESMRHPSRYFANNIGSAIVLLNAMIAHDVSRFVFSSSAAVYGDPEKVPVEEDAPLKPTSPYGESKATIERLLSWYSSQCGLSYASLRYFNAAGATDVLGEDHRPETHLIPTALQVASGERDMLPLYGSNYPTPDGTCVRDYIHVADLAEAHVLALQRLEPKSALICNLGSGRPYSNREVIEAARRVTGAAIRADEMEARSGDPALLLASREKAREKLGWEPRITNLDEIVETSWRWHQAHPNGYSS